ncbi:MAG: response regulator transcription factor [Proteobacteria bacterium]|nr:response regulator transcription factor [Pseudomonadota bacterium]
MENLTRKTKVVIVDDHEIIREAIAKLIDKEQYDVVACFKTGKDSVEFLEAGNEVDVILMDIVLEEENGINVAREIINKFKGIKIIILTISDSLEDIKQAARVGVKGFLTKSASTDRISHAISMVMSGDVVFPASIYNVENVDIFSRGKQPGGNGLSKREVEILRYLAKGLSNKEIAYDLHLAEGTVKVHVKKILTKLGLQNRTQGAIYAINNGWGPSKEEISKIMSRRQ